MSGPIIIQLGAYNPARMLNCLRVRFRLDSDAELSRTLGLAPAMLSKIRHRRQAVGAAFILRVHDVTGVPVQDLRRMMGDRRATVRLARTQDATWQP